MPKLLTDQKVDGDDPYGRVEGEQTPELLHHADGSTYVNIVPMRLGKLTIRFTADFADGGYASQSVNFEVGPSKVAPAALGLSSGAGLYMDTTHPSPAYLLPTAFYYGLRWEIPVPPRYATFKVEDADGGPVVKIDPTTGRVTPLRLGDAMVETSYLGVTMRNCVRVRDEPSAVYSNCAEVRHLEQLAASTPLNQAWTQDPSEGPSFFAANINFYTKRLSLIAPDHPVALGQAVHIPVRLSGDKVRSIAFRQWIYNGYGFGVPANVKGPDGVWLGENKWIPSGEKGAYPLKDGGETGKFIDIVPLALGNVEIGIAVYFEDRGFDQRFFRIKVLPSSQGLESFQGHDPVPLQVSGGEKSRHSIPLLAEVTYKNVQGAIRLNSLEGAKFSIQQPLDAPVVDVDDKGVVRALRPGEAVVLADFDGTKWSYPIHVTNGER
jgi:hypothetical protein